jgi:hypothetical protein
MGRRRTPAYKGPTPTGGSWFRLDWLLENRRASGSPREISKFFKDQDGKDFIFRGFRKHPVVSLNRPPGEKPSHQSFRRATLYNTFVLYATTKVHLRLLAINSILRRMKAFEVFVGFLVLAATVLALVYRHTVQEIALPIFYSIF